MRNKRHTRFYNKVNQILEVPREVMEEVPKFTIISFDEMLIENYKNITDKKSIELRRNSLNMIKNQDVKPRVEELKNILKSFNN